MIWRDADLVSHFRALHAEEAALLRHFQGNGAFAGACEILLTWHAAKSVPPLALNYLRSYAEAGWLMRLSGAPQPRSVRQGPITAR